VAIEPLRNLLTESGYAVHFRHDIWTECFASHEKERWRGRGVDEEDALADVLRQMFPSSFAWQLLEQQPLMVELAPSAEQHDPALPAPAPPLEAAPLPFDFPDACPADASPADPAERALAAAPEATAPEATAPEAISEAPLAVTPRVQLGAEPTAVVEAPSLLVEAGDSAAPLTLAPASMPSGRAALIAAAARTDRGIAGEPNDDAFLVFAERGLIAIADGLGAHPGANVASTLVIETLRQAFANESSLSPIRRKGLPLLLAAVEKANAAILESSKRDRTVRGKGTTLAAVLIVGRQVALAHAGDSRIYRLRRGVLELLTTDHSRSNDRLRSTSRTAAQAPITPTPTRVRSEVTRAVGARRSVEIDTSVVTSQPGDVLLLCTAGLHGVVAHQHLAEQLALHADPAVAAEHLVALANAGGGLVNVTAAVVRWER